MKKGELQTTRDINQKFLMGKLNGDEVWALEEKSKANNKQSQQIKMEIKLEDLEFDEDFLSERAEEMKLFQLKLELPKGLRVTGFTFGNRLLIRKSREDSA